MKADRKGKTGPTALRHRMGCDYDLYNETRCFGTILMAATVWRGGLREDASTCEKILEAARIDLPNKAFVPRKSFQFAAGLILSIALLSAFSDQGSDIGKAASARRSGSC